MTQLQKSIRELAVLQKDITDEVIGKIAELKGEGLVLPPNYSAENALKSAFFTLQGVEDKNQPCRYAAGPASPMHCSIWSFRG